MTSSGSHRLFVLLMLGAFATAFFVPHRVSDRARAHLQVLFAPVAVPTRWVAQWVHARVWPKGASDDASPAAPRDLGRVLEENEQLRVTLANVAGQLEHFRAIAGEREALGAVRDRCTRYAVMSADTGPRDALALVGLSAGGLAPGTAVLTPAGVIGRVERSGTGGAQVLLLTDRRSVFTASFGRIASDPADGQIRFQPHAFVPTLVRGLGRGKMLADKITWKDVTESGLAAGDWCVLDDPAWPAPLKWYRAGRVTEVRQASGNILFAEVTIEPVVDAARLRDVMVMDR